MKSQHTPGPWSIDSRPDADKASMFGVIHGPATKGQPATSNWVADVGLLHNGDGSGSLANARLISEAPALLAALEQIERLSQDADPKLVHVPAMLGDIARRAIRKVKGEIP